MLLPLDGLWMSSPYEKLKVNCRLIAEVWITSKMFSDVRVCLLPSDRALDVGDYAFYERSWSRKRSEALPFCDNPIGTVPLFRSLREIGRSLGCAD